MGTYNRLVNFGPKIPNGLGKKCQKISGGGGFFLTHTVYPAHLTSTSKNVVKRVEIIIAVSTVDTEVVLLNTLVSDSHNTQHVNMSLPYHCQLTICDFNNHITQTLTNCKWCYQRWCTMFHAQMTWVQHPSNVQQVDNQLAEGNLLCANLII